MFVPPERGTLTKQYVMTEILPKIFHFLNEKELLDENGEMNCCFILAHKDKIISVCDSLCVIENARFCALGDGEGFAFPYLNDFDYQGDAAAQLLEAMKSGARHRIDVNGPFIFIDTKNQTYTFKEG